MKKNKLYKDKYIPIEYIVNSEENRLNLLAGMIDANGSIKKQNNTFGYRLFLNKKRIIESLRIIAGSLGFKAKIYECQDDMLELIITGYNLSKIPVKVQRNKIQDDTLFTNPMIHKIEIEEINNGKFCGWHIDSNERFLLSDFTITHNTRLLGGKDHSSPRYIFTQLNKIIKYIIRKEDNGILEYLDDDGYAIEPKMYYPIIPLVLINGAEGIGTGFSTFIPNYDIFDVIDIIMAKLTKNKSRSLEPYYNGFKGKIEKIDDDTYLSQGIYTLENDKLSIKELPLRMWTSEYKAFLEELVYTGSELFSSVSNQSSEKMYILFLK